MREVNRQSDSFLQRASLAIDDIVGVFSPRAALQRKAYRFGYDILDRHRTRRKRSTLGGTGDQHLTGANLDKLREICRDLGRNNPLVKGLLRTEAIGVVGTSTQIQARTEDEEWNQAAEQLWQEEMINQPCDVTGRFNFHAVVKKAFYTYRRDGDMFVLFADSGLQAIEGDQVGTPYGKMNAQNFDVTNGVAVSKQTKRVIGYYIGKPNKWGYIANDSFQNYTADVVHHVFNPERFSSSRGEPALISAVDMIDKLCSYIDAELVAAKINACFPLMITTHDTTGMPPPFTGGVSSSGRAGKDEAEARLEKISPGMIWYGEPGEKAEAIGQARPASAFDPFILRLLGLIGRPLCMPLILITGDFSHATFMNARIAYQEARDNWRDEQELVVKPFVRRVWLWKVRQWIERKDLTETDDWAKHEVFCKRWPYVDPFREAQADKIALESGTTNRTLIGARQGIDFKDLTKQRAAEEEYLKELGIELGEKKANQAVR